MDASIERIRGRELIRRGPYARLFWSQFISSLGDWVTLFATFSVAARISGGGEAASVAILVPLVARFIPGLLFGVLGGVLADRWNRKATMLVADFGRAALVLVLVAVGNYRDLFLITFAIEVLSLIRQPAREAVVPELIAPRHLMAANGLNLIAGYGTAPLGSALFALLTRFGDTILPGVANPGVTAAFILDAVTFVLGGVIVIFIPIKDIEVAPDRRASSRLDIRAPLRDMVDGFRFVLGFGAVRRMVLGMAAGLFGGGAVFVLGQPFSEQILGAGDSGYGLLVTSLGVGVAVGMTAMTVFGRGIQRREPLFAVALFLTGLSIMFTSSVETVAAGAGWVFVAGLATGIAYVTGFTHLHAVVTDEVRGRTFAALFSAARAALLVSFGLAGIGAATLRGILPGLYSSGIRSVLLVSGAVILVSGLGGIWAARSQMGGGPLGEDEVRTLQDVSDAVTWIRGDRRSKPR